MSVPKLRFKEFDGDWSIFPLENQVDFLAGYAFDSKLMCNDIKQYQLIKMSNVYQNQLDLTRNSSYWKNLNSKTEKFLLKQGDIVLTLTGTVGKTDYGYNVEINENNKFLLNQRLVRLRGKQNLSVSKFIQYRISTDKFFYHFFNSSKGGTGNQSNVSIEDLKLLELPFPSKEEQTKIASFLSAVDEKMNQLSQKHSLLSQYKQGMMQKLFSQQIRFKADDGSEFGEWQEKALIDSVDTNIKWSFTGGPFGSNLKSDDYTESGIRIIQLQNIGDGLFLNDYKIYTSLKKANELLSCNIYPNEILISKMGDPVARCCIVPNHHERYVMCSDGIRLVVDKKRYSHIFMFYQINYQDFRQSASDVSTGSTRKRIGLSDLKRLPIKVPCLAEQTKIANFLSAIDQKIDLVAQQIQHAKQWKKGLLQQMFV